MASAHTPGPRRTCPCNSLNEHYCHNLPDRLIAAAPRMLDLIRDAVDTWDFQNQARHLGPDKFVDPEQIRRARAILRDVKGESNGS